MSLVEVLIAVGLIAIAVAPAADFLMQSDQATSVEHLQLEASNLATTTIETLQAEAAQGQLLPPGVTQSTTTVSENGSHATDFTVTQDVETVQQGTNQSVCATSAGVLQQIWKVTVTVTWPGLKLVPVVRTTEIAPAQAGAIQQSAGELAIRLSLDGGSTNLFTSSPPGVNATLTGTWGPGGSHTAPSGTYDNEGPYNSGSSGCLVFQDLDPTPGMTYSVSFGSNPTIVTGQEYATANPTGTYAIGPLTVQPGVPDIQTVQLDVGTNVQVHFSGPIKAPATCPTTGTGVVVPAPTTSPIPISVENSFLTSYPNETWDAYASSGTPGSLLLFPWPSNTAMWYGDQPDSNPASVYGAAGPAACPVDDTAAGVLGGTVNVYLPLYPLVLTVSNGPTTLTATEVAGGGHTFALNAPYAATATSVPLGEYSLQDQHGNLSSYVWVTPTGECTDTAVHSSPPSPCTSATLAVAG